MAEWLKALAWKACIRETVSWVRIPLPPPLQNRTANAKRSRLYAGRGGQCLNQIALRADDADLALGDLDALSERAEMVAAIAAALDPDPLACRPGEALNHLRRDGLLVHADRSCFAGRSIRGQGSIGM